MPLRDHFRPPIAPSFSWEGFHGTWPAFIVNRLDPHLPDDYRAEPRVHLGTQFEVDVCAFEQNAIVRAPTAANGTGSMPWTVPSPTAVVDLETIEHYAYEVLIFNGSHELVAAIELVSPGNQDRPDTRSAFVTKCLALVQKKVSVSIVDLVTRSNFNLFGQMLDELGQADATDFTRKSPAIYATTCRRFVRSQRPSFQAWAYPLEVGAELPTLPVWLNEELSIPLELEASYEDTCRVLRVPNPD